MKPNAPESVKIEVVNCITKPTEIELLMLFVVQGIIVNMANHIQFDNYDYKVVMSVSGDKDEAFTIIDIEGNMKEYFIEKRVNELLSPYVHNLRFMFNKFDLEGNHLRILLQRFDVETRHINHFIKVPIPVKNLK